MSQTTKATKSVSDHIRALYHRLTDLDSRLAKLESRTDGGKATNLRGGLPIVVDGHLIGAIGVGSGTGEQDVEVAAAGVAALAGAKDRTSE